MNSPTITTAASARWPWLRDSRWWLAAIVLAAVVLRTVPFTYTHFWDEAVFLQHAKVMLGHPDNYDEFVHRPPLLSLMYAAGFALWGSIYMANIVQGVVSGAGVAFAYLFVRQAFTRRAAIIAAALLAFTPYIVDESHDLLTDMPAVTLMLAAMWLFEKRGVWPALLCGAAYSAAIQTRYTSIFLVVYFVLRVAIAPRTYLRLILMGVAAGMTLAPYLIWLRLTFGSFLYPFVLARRIVNEYTAPVPASMYAHAFVEIFPISIWILFLAGLVTPSLRRRQRDAGRVATSADGSTLRLVLVAWGVAFVAYMLSTPHKEVRYLLPTAIPILIVAGLGGDDLLALIPRRNLALRLATALLVITVAILDYGRSFTRLGQSWLDDYESCEVSIAKYLKAHATADDTVYAAHNFPVLAFYSECRTVSLLPIQQHFADDWRAFMDKPGYLVITHPESVGEIHCVDAVLKPDQAFVDAHEEFQLACEFAEATVYRYRLPVAEHGRRPYLIKEGDTLRGIAARELGDERRYGEIQDLNRIAPESLRVGQLIQLPADATVPAQ